MTEDIKNLIRPLIPKPVLLEYRRRQQKKEIKSWQQQGCFVPPPHLVKQLTIRQYQQRYRYTTMVETGTYMGEMVEALKTEFKRIISIELARELYEKAKRRFIKDDNITIVHGDSGKVLPSILSNMSDPAIFWLDGHYSRGETAKGDKECPIFEELDSIFGSENMNHVLLIDDARCFVGKNDYPSIGTLTDYIRGKNKNYRVEVKHDIIRCVV
jgi:hypothetical protein